MCGFPSKKPVRSLIAYFSENVRSLLHPNTAQRSPFALFYHCRSLLSQKYQSRAQSSPAPRSAVGRRGELWGHGIFTAEIVRFRFLCACAGDVIRWKNGSHHEVNFFQVIQPYNSKAVFLTEY